AAAAARSARISAWALGSRSASVRLPAQARIALLPASTTTAPTGTSPRAAAARASASAASIGAAPSAFGSINSCGSLGLRARETYPPRPVLASNRTRHGASHHRHHARFGAARRLLEISVVRVARELFRRGGGGGRPAGGPPARARDGRGLSR